MTRKSILHAAAVAAVAIFGLGLGTRAEATSFELISNGDFETGTFAGWTVTDLAGGSGSWFIDDADGTTPLSGYSTVGPQAGSFYAVSDQTGPGTHALTQTFTIPGPASSVLLSFDMFVNDWADDPVVNRGGLDHTLLPNQHGRVDILYAGAAPFDTGDGVVTNLFIGSDPGTDPHPYTPYAFDLTPFVGGGGTFQLRFAEVDNRLFFNQGVDNVSLQFTPVPEPGTLVLLGSGLVALALGAARRRRSHR